MITAKNYAAQAERGLSETKYNESHKRDEVLARKYYINYLNKAVHFAIPDNAKILDDNKKGIINEAIRLPFPCITIEYHQPDPGVKLDIKSTASSKRVILAREFTYEEAAKEFSEWPLYKFGEDMTWIFITCASYIDEEKVWFLDLFGWMMPSAWDYTPGGEGIEFKDGQAHVVNSSSGYDEHARKELGVSGFPIPVSPTSISVLQEYSQRDNQNYIGESIADIGSEIAAVLEFCEALTCSNVYHQVMEPIDPKVNEKRIRKGKLPLYETRTLYINTPNIINNSDGEHQGGTHRSPRQHLRRGHIRRLQSGKKVWVNSAIVGSRDNGILHKDYKVRGQKEVA